MHVFINPELERFVAAQVTSGLYPSADEVLADALHLLAARNAGVNQDRAAMDAFIQEGIDSAKRDGWVTPEQLDAGLDALFVDLNSRHAP